MEEDKKKAKKTVVKKEDKKVKKSIAQEPKKEMTEKKVIKVTKKEKLMKVPKEFYYGTGKRKTAIAKVWLFNGKGNILVNDMSVRDYFCSEVVAYTVLEPLLKLNVEGKYDFKISVLGGGLIGQAGACRHGISRALLKMNEDFKGVLKENGYLTRDPRVKERKKYGRKKARKGFQFRKR
jgi:small subunit ribosomal protein S9